MKITEFNECIERMRKVYNFEDSKTEVKIDRDVISNQQGRYVVIDTNDIKHDVMVHLETRVHRDMEKNLE